MAKSKVQNWAQYTMMLEMNIAPNISKKEFMEYVEWLRDNRPQIYTAYLYAELSDMLGIEIEDLVKRIM